MSLWYIFGSFFRGITATKNQMKDFCNSEKLAMKQYHINAEFERNQSWIDW